MNRLAAIQQRLTEHRRTWTCSEEDGGYEHPQAAIAAADIAKLCDDVECLLRIAQAAQALVYEREHNLSVDDYGLTEQFDALTDALAALDTSGAT